MAFEKGNSRGPGRPKGAINTRTYLAQALKEKRVDFLTNYLKTIDTIENPYEKAQAMKPMLEFIYTKPSQDHEISIQDLITSVREALKRGDESS